MKLRRQRDVPRGVDLVRGHDHRQRSSTKQIRDLVVTRPQSRPRVHDQYSHVGVGERRPHLLVDGGSELGAIVEIDPAGVDERQRPAVPVGVELLAIAGDAGALVHDRLPRLGEAVDERGLADVRIPDDCDLHGGSEASVPPDPPIRSI